MAFFARLLRHRMVELGNGPSRRFMTVGASVARLYMALDFACGVFAIVARETFASDRRVINVYFLEAAVAVAIRTVIARLWVVG